MLRRPLVGCLVLALIGCRSAGQAKATTPPIAHTVHHGRVHAVPHHLRHLFLIVLENREYSPSQDPPFLSDLRHRGTAALRSFAITHPSLPNYLALLSGSTAGISSDCGTCIARGQTLVDQLEGRHFTWRAYMEDLPTPCFRGTSSASYAKKHDPFMYFPQIVGKPSRCKNVVSLSRFLPELRGKHSPNFSWISPNLCHDGHDCGDDAVDGFLRRYVPPILSSKAYGDHGKLVITYDEGESDAGCCALARGGHIETVVLGPGIRPGASIESAVDHYSLLRSIEEGFALRRLGNAACPCTPKLIDLGM